MQEAKMIRAKGNGIEIQLAVWDGGDTPILCVHGLTANSRCWDVVVRPLMGRHRVLSVDLRGRGLSDKPASGYSEEHHLRDLKCVIDDLQLDRIVLMGHSLGGYISLGLAARHPERVTGLILMDGGGDLSPEYWDRVTAAIKPAIDRLEMTFPSKEAFFDLMKQAPFLQPWSDEIEAYFEYDLVETADGIRSRIQPENIREELSNKRKTSISQYYSQVECPVLIVRATEGILQPDDILLPQDAVDSMLATIPDARAVDIVGTNHYSILFQPNTTRDNELLAFLYGMKAP
jgi:pimeloyl-ACP methyl ester carboxylesterase